MALKSTYWYFISNFPLISKNCTHFNDTHLDNVSLTYHCLSYKTINCHLLITKRCNLHCWIFIQPLLVFVDACSKTSCPACVNYTVQQLHSQLQQYDEESNLGPQSLCDNSFLKKRKMIFLVGDWSYLASLPGNVRYFVSHHWIIACYGESCRPLCLA